MPAPARRPSQSLSRVVSLELNHLIPMHFHKGRATDDAVWHRWSNARTAELWQAVAIFMFLKAKPVCQSCNLYLRPLAKKQKSFADAELAGGYYDRLFTLPVDGPEFAELIRSAAKVDKPAQGALSVVTSLLGCPTCKAQMIEEKVQGFNGKEWKDISKLDRRVNIPHGVDLAPLFRG